MTEEPPIQDADAPRPPGTTRAAFVARFPECEALIAQEEARFGPFERIASLAMRDGRAVVLARYAQAWYVSFSRPDDAATPEGFECFLSPEAMVALWALYDYLRTPPSHAADWALFRAAVAQAESPGSPEPS
jgi:hypothetical protein